MNKNLLMLFTLLCIMCGVYAQKTYVLIVGVSNYGGANNLPACTKDAKTMKNIFDNQGATVSLLTGKNANHDNILIGLRAMAKLSKPEDKIIYFYTGHGGPHFMCIHGGGELYYKEVYDALLDAKTDKIFCFFSCCNSGTAGDVIKQNANNKKMVFCSSARAEEYGFQNSDLGSSYFGKAMMKGLRGKADINGDNQVTMQELFKYVHSDVTRRFKNSDKGQHPMLFGSSYLFDTVLSQW